MERNRQTSLDILRIAGAFAVVLFHVMTGSVANDPQVSAGRRNITIAAAEILRCAVPVFFMITGYIWLSDSRECIYSGVFRNIRRFIAVLFTAGFFYALLERVFTAKTVSAQLVAAAFADVFTGNLWAHMWYLYAITGVYILLPVLKPFYMHSTLKNIRLFVGILFLFAVFIPASEAVWGYNFALRLPVTEAGFYTALGGLAAKTHKKNTNRKWIHAAAFTICSARKFFLMATNTVYAGIIPVLNCICAESMFRFVTEYAEESRHRQIIRTMAECSFGVYLFHPFFINLMIKFLHIYPMRFMPCISLVLTALVIGALSFAGTFVLRKIKFVKKYIL